MGTFSRVFGVKFDPFLDPHLVPPSGPPWWWSKIDPFLYILFTLVLGHILHKKYVGIWWELFRGFLGSNLTHFLTLFRYPPSGPPRWTIENTPLPIYIIYVSFRTYFAQKICGDLMGTFSRVFGVKFDPFLDPQKPVFGPPFLGGTPQKRVFGHFWTPPFPEHLRPKSTPVGGGLVHQNPAVDPIFPLWGYGETHFYCGILVRARGSKNPFLGVFGTPPYGGVIFYPPHWGVIFDPFFDPHFWPPPPWGSFLTPQNGGPIYPPSYIYYLR